MSKKGYGSNIMEKLVEQKRILPIAIFGLYLLIFFTIDYLNMPYPQMAQQEGVIVVIIHILLNLVMTGLSTYLFMMHEGIFNQINRNVKGSNTPIYASLFGLLTYGCTPCVISFFAAFGIQFSVMALPWAGLPYKFISLLILLFGIAFSKHQMKKACEI